MSGSCRPFNAVALLDIDEVDLFRAAQASGARVLPKGWPGIALRALPREPRPGQVGWSSEANEKAAPQSSSRRSLSPRPRREATALPVP
jgi:hypothetical protein